MKRIILATALMAGGVIGGSAQTLPQNVTQYENCIEVSGNSEREVVPDEIYIRIVVSENTSRRSSLEKMENEMIARLRGLGVDTDTNLRLWDMSSELKEYWLRRNTSRTTTSYQLKVSDGATLARVYQALDELGITNIAITRLSHSRIKEIQDQVRIEAVRNARSVAVSLAEALGQKAGRAVYIVDYTPVGLYGINARMNYMAADEAYKSEDGGEPTPDMRNIRITHSVNAKFVLE